MTAVTVRKLPRTLKSVGLVLETANDMAAVDVLLKRLEPPINEISKSEMRIMNLTVKEILQPC